VQRAAKSGRLPARRIGKEWRFLRAQVAQVRGLRLRPAVRPDSDDLFPRSPFEADGGTANAGMGAEEAAEFLRVKEWTVRSEANQGRLPGWREGSRWRFSREELIEHMGTDEPHDSIRYDRRAKRS
jgi:excisionase family DNA binding protein